MMGVLATALPEFLRSLGPWAPIGLIASLVIQQLCPVFPSSALIALSAVLFGPLWGALYSWIGIVASAVLLYLLGRHGRGKWSGHPVLLRLEGWLSSGRHPGVSILTLRAIPIFPFNLVSLGAGSLQLRFWPFLCATALGSLPGLCLYVGLGSTLLRFVNTYFLRM